MKKACLGTLILATVGTGLMAGFALTYAIAVMPGLADTGDAAFVEAFHEIDHALDSSTWFWMVVFLGSLFMTALSAFFVFRLKMRSILVWSIAAAALYAVGVAIAAVGIDPLESDFGNARGQTGGGLDVAVVRAEVDEDRWAVLNGIRLVTNVVAFAGLAWSLVLFGRASSETGVPPVSRTG